MTAPILELNGLAGVGKFTIGRIVAGQIGACLIDNHMIYNPALATTEFGSAAFFETVRAVRDIVFERVAALPAETPVVLTIAPGRNRAWGAEWQQAIRELAHRREAPLFGVHLRCTDAEGARRIATPSRAAMRKLTDPAVIATGDRPVLLDHCDDVLDLDVTRLDAGESAAAILRWLEIRGG